MFSLNDSMRYWLYSEPTDMRKSFFSLSGIVTNLMEKGKQESHRYICRTPCECQNPHFKEAI
jgi:hypothetical protein